MNPGDLSVVVPCHNVGSTLAEQLDALLAQDCGGAFEFEVVLVENRSTDDTLAVARTYAARDSRVRVVTADARGGASYARNTGIRAAGAQMVVLCDGDDIVRPGWLAAMANGLAEHPVVTGPVNADLLNPAWLVRTRGALPMDAPRKLLGRIPIAPSGNIAMRRDVWEKVGGYDEDIDVGEDQEFCIRLWEQHIPIHFAPGAEIAYRYRTDARSLFRQGRFYGRGRPLVYRRAAAAGVRAPRFAGWRSWLLLVAWLPRLRSVEGRASWCWLAGVRLGQLEGSLRQRSLYL
ncbi:MAG TPA: glycosyltransferase family A protein [Acidimicrobiia bacterium]